MKREEKRLTSGQHGMKLPVRRTVNGLCVQGKYYCLFLKEGLPPKVSNSKDNVIGIGIYILCIKEVTNEKPLFSTGNSTQCSAVT